MIKVGIIGVTGYSGINLLALLLGHPKVKIQWITSVSFAGEKIAKVYPFLTGLTDLTCSNHQVDKLAKVDVVFAALPHGLAMGIVPDLLEKGTKVIDLGADFRLKDQSQYHTWYDLEHTYPKLLKSAVYGLPEAYASKIKKAKLVANPGCYAASAILGLWPLAKKKLIQPGTIIIDAKSGVSGAGKTPTLGSHFPECNENFSAYKVACHRHTPEIEQEVGEKVTFTPHLTPLTRGIFSTIYLKLKKHKSAEQLQYIYEAAYQTAPFVRIVDKLPSVKQVAGSNFCDICVQYDEHTECVIILSVIDNLIKGASGQAIQNMNIMFGLPEVTGLTKAGMYP